MPNKDGTGPFGKGPKTGKQMGNCKDAEPQTNNGRGFGKRCNKPYGRGFRNKKE